MTICREPFNRLFTFNGSVSSTSFYQLLKDPRCNGIDDSRSAGLVVRQQPSEDLALNWKGGIKFTTKMQKTLMLRGVRPIKRGSCHCDTAPALRPKALSPSFEGYFPY